MVLIYIYEFIYSVMPGNSFGELFRVTTFGESHGVAIGGIVDGCPAGMKLDVDYIQKQLDRRKPGQSRYVTQRREDDEVQILSGWFEGITTGTPIGLFIYNKDQKSKDYSDIKNQYRPAHADYTYDKKYGIRDYRGGGRSSARETAVRVAAGAIARQFLKEEYGVVINAYISQLGEHKITQCDFSEIDNNAFFCPDSSLVPALEVAMQDLIKEGNSIGAQIDVEVSGVPAGWGEPVFDRLDADIAKALMSINAVKGVGIGAGFDCVAQKGTQHRDEITPKGFLSNNAGGILGGISSGQNIIARMAVKPTSSLRIAGQSIDNCGNAIEVVTKGRHDPCVGIRAVPIAEAMVALVLIDHALRQRAYRLK